MSDTEKEEEFAPDRLTVMNAMILSMTGTEVSVSREEIEKRFEEDYELSMIDLYSKVVLVHDFDSDPQAFVKATLREMAVATSKGLDPIEEVESWLEGRIEEIGEAKTDEILALVSSKKPAGDKLH